MYGTSKLLRMWIPALEGPRTGERSPKSEDDERELAVSDGVGKGGVVDHP